MGKRKLGKRFRSIRRALKKYDREEKALLKKAKKKHR